jgi:hypothetical protein
MALFVLWPRGKRVRSRRADRGTTAAQTPA